MQVRHSPMLKHEIRNLKHVHFTPFKVTAVTVTPLTATEFKYK